MAIVSVSAEIGCRAEETARLAAARLGYHLLTEFDLAEALDEEFGSIEIPPPAWTAAVQSILCRIAAEHHLLLVFPGCEHLFQGFSAVLRIHLTASEARKIGNFMLEYQLDRPASKRRLAAAVKKRQALYQSRFAEAGRCGAGADLAIQMDNWTTEQASHLIHSAAESRHLNGAGLPGRRDR